ncbi:lysophospholipase [Sparassis latifolia]
MLSKGACVALLCALPVVLAQNVTSYAPSYVQCPSESLIRHAGTPQARNQTLHPGEVRYVAERKRLAREGLKAWLGAGNHTVYHGELDDLADHQVPTIALSLSGGGYRASLFNAASLHAFDARNATSVASGLGGLLQSATYMTALSGGSYVSTSLMFNEFPPLPDLVFGNNATGIPGWQLDQGIYAPGPSGEYEMPYIGDIMYDLVDKRAAGDFPVSFCDMWGRALSYHFLPGTSPGTFTTNATAGNHGAATTYSSATELDVWKNRTMPFPIILQNVNSPNAKGQPFGSTGTVPLTSVVYEVTPLEFGSYEPQLAAFVSLPYLGSIVAAGQPKMCANGFDNAGLMIGTSACDFNPYNITNNPIWTSPQALEPLWQRIVSAFNESQPGQEMDATGVPNPFYGISSEYQDSGETNLNLFDGSLDCENDPVLPLLVKKRAVDVIIVTDSSGETDSLKPNGLSLLATQAKGEILPEDTIAFPRPFPNSTEEFVDLGLNQRPVFFGCGRAKNPDHAFP